MEAIAAFALAGTVVTFVDFSSKLIQGAKELYKAGSGTLTANEELELVTSDLRSVLAKIQLFNARSNGAVEDSEFEKGFVGMCDSAKVLAEELLGRLEKLKVGKGVKGARRLRVSLFQAVSNAWSRGELAALVIKLRDLKEHVELRILFALRQNFDLLSLKLSEGFDKLDRQTQYIVSAMAESGNSRMTSEALEQTATLAKLLARLEVSHSQEHRKTREMISSVGHRAVTSSIEVLEVPYDKECLVRKSVGNQILRDLHYEAMTHRYEEVADALQKTFDWVFDESTDEQKPWSNFSDWLRHGESVYWVKGKAGAGKSTLMKYIYEHPRTRQYLTIWASNLPLHVVSFFFWLSGTREQKSQLGLLRSLLFEVLNQEPDLIPVVLPLFWARTYTCAVTNKSSVVNNSWTLRSLKDAFRLLVSQDIVPVKICLFIDGLDEFDGDHEEISELFKGITSPNVKVCLSSRPWVVFEECFRGLPFLRLQDLTRPDIELYVKQSLAENSAFRKLEADHPLPTNAFMQEIVDRADGVFLWVVLVVRSLLNGIRNRDAIPDLQSRLRRLPRELEPLYSHLLSRIEPEYLPWASKTFQILRVVQQLRIKNNKSFIVEAQDCTHTDDDERTALYEEKQGNDDVRTLTVLGLHLALECQNYFGLDDTTENRTLRIINSNFEDTEIQLTARCAGLLETWHVGSGGPISQIQYLHRTARDYLLGPQVWENLLSHTSVNDFNPHVAMISSYILQISVDKIISTKPIGGPLSIAFRTLIHAHLAEDEVFTTPPNVLSILEVLMSQAHQTGTTLSHWSRKMTPGLPDAISFRPIAAMFGLNSYLVSSQFKGPYEFNGVSLLHYAIPRNWSARCLLPRLSTVELLLKHCDANQAYKFISPWQQAISYAREQQKRGDPWSEKAQFLRILSILLRGGADPQAQSQSFGYSYGVQNLLNDLKREGDVKMVRSSPLEVAELSEEFQRAIRNQERGHTTAVAPEHKDNSKGLWTKKISSWLKN